jgi:hypothetical protein
MPGLPKKFAKMGFKKGWAAFKSLHGGGKKRKRNRMSGERVLLGRKKYAHPGWEKHAPKYLYGDILDSKPQLVSSPIKRLSSITPKRVLAPVVDLGLIIAGMAAGSFIKTNVMKASPIKNAHIMNGAQTVIGVGGSLMTRNRFVKMPMLGVALQSAIAEAKLLIPKIPLSGDDETVFVPMEEETPKLVYAGEGDRFSGDEYENPVEYVEVEGDDRVSGSGSDRFSGDDDYFGEVGEMGE